MSETAPARPAASVVVLRDRNATLEVLLVQRNEKVAFHGGAWVFPGGRVDEIDRPHPAAEDVDIARHAAAREAREEAGLELPPQAMVPFSHWTTPADLPKRFATWFFAAPAAGGAEVRVDNSEIVAHRWMTPATALAAQAAGEMMLPAPTFVTLLRFSAFADPAVLMDHLRAEALQRFLPRLLSLEGARCALYQEDAGYATLDAAAPGPRHRLLMKDPHWQYIREL